jgi:hypothetical protein
MTDKERAQEVAQNISTQLGFLGEKAMEAITQEIAIALSHERERVKARVWEIGSKAFTEI